MSGVGDLFDSYALRARVYPALLAAAPVAAIVVVVWPHSPAQALWALAVAVGAVYFLASWVRDRGKRLEKQLVDEWGGMPTTHLLRWRENQATLEFLRRRDLLQAATKISLPYQDAETAASDATYVAATRALIARTRGDQPAFKLIHDENTQFGFRRNLLAMKPLGVILTSVSLAFDLAWAIVVSPGPGLLLGIVHALVLAAWVVIVSADWVRTQGETYAERLFEALEHLVPPVADTSS
ncbi:hypothetical protein [Nocardioides sp. Iso805N]|uniref:hypothetical protein n=1 Tax=Nocardioides sp. Iso805N TaxID=1283287 RepID=UPI00037EC7DD|nr:hypothetical protein [Nocardioides sp. Iso805N]